MRSQLSSLQYLNAMPYPMSYELYRAPGFYAWFSKEPRPCCNTW